MVLFGIVREKRIQPRKQCIFIHHLKETSQRVGLLEHYLKAEQIKRIEGKLGNEGFVAKAPEAVIAKEREKLDGYKETLVKLAEQQATIAAL